MIFEKINAVPYYSFQVVGAENRPLLNISATGEVTAPDLECASDAGRVFVESIRCHLPNIEAQEAEILRLREALQWVEPLLEDMIADDNLDDEPCFSLCTNAWCQRSGCLIDKLNGVRAALSPVLIEDGDLK